VPFSTAADGYACGVMLLAKASKILGESKTILLAKCCLLSLALTPN